MHKILLVEDEKNFGMVLRDYLRMSGFEVYWAENGELGSQSFRENKFDLCILDIMMPRKDGFTLSAEIRSLNEQVPIIFLTARTMKEDMVRAYKNGADDYIVKPFDSELLLLKVNAILQRQRNKKTELLSEYLLGSFVFNVKMRSLKGANQVLKLSPKEAELLALLCSYKNDVLPREKALKEIWKEDNYFTGRSMDVYIAKLRKYLSAEKGVEIESLHGKGFSLRVD
jgi:two-component system OmpR family response regulator